MTRSLQTYALYLHILAFLIVLAIGAGAVLVPGAQTTNVQLNTSSIYLAVDRGVVFAPGACVNVEWRVDGVREVYFDNQPTIGQDAQQVCLQSETTPALRVVLVDGSVNEYTLPVQFFIHQPLALFLLLASIGIGISLLALLVLPRHRPHVRSTALTTQPAAVGWFQRMLVTVGAVTLGVIGTALSLELALRFIFTNFGTESDRISYIYTREEVNELNRSAVVLPFIGYTLNPAVDGYNAFGLRGPEITPEKPAGTFRIIALGDSSTFGATEDTDTYPAWLQRILREDYGLTNVEVINAGVQGYTTWHTLSNFEFRMLELDPDLIIFYQSVIDISGRAANPDCYRGANLLRGLDPRNVMVSTYNQGTFSISTLYRFLTIKLGLERDPADPSSSASETYITCGDGQTYADAEAYALNPPVYYERNLRSLIGIAQIQGVDLLLSTWAYDRADPNAVPEWRAAADEQNAIVTRLADQYDLPYIDFATVAPEGIALWVDHLHLNGEGSRLQAEAYAAYLVEQGIIPAS